MVLRSINSVPAGRLAYSAICELIGLHGGDIRGLSLELGCDEERIGQLPRAPSVRRLPAHLHAELWSLT